MKLEATMLWNAVPNAAMGQMIVALLNEKFGDGIGSPTGPEPLRFVFCRGRPGSSQDGALFIICTRGYDSLATEVPK